MKSKKRFRVSGFNTWLWIVEIRKPYTQRWGSTAGCAFTRDEGRQVLRSWRRSNPSDDFRLALYSSAGAGK